MAEVAAEQTLSREAALVALRSLAKQLGINLTKRKALQAIPIIGAGVGAAVNGSYIRDVGWAARRAYQERWLADKNKI
ncbi:DNA-binding transcriptional regulator YhcF (GntR family) [Azospirillum sp. OGB3]|nr:DNA-binding transcriptional regulator YhcF (GntR family) [Azospirillum sp. OGB3]